MLRQLAMCAKMLNLESWRSLKLNTTTLVRARHVINVTFYYTWVEGRGKQHVQSSKGLTGFYLEQGQLQLAGIVVTEQSWNQWLVRAHTSRFQSTYFFSFPLWNWWALAVHLHVSSPVSGNCCTGEWWWTIVKCMQTIGGRRGRITLPSIPDRICFGVLKILKKNYRMLKRRDGFR